MSRIFTGFPINPATEIIVMGAIGMGMTVMEDSLFDFNSNFIGVWNMPVPEDVLSSTSNYLTKSILSSVATARSMMQRLNLFLYICLMYSMFMEDKPFFLIPWLIVSLLKNIILDVVTLTLGTFICWTLKEVKPVCVEFIASKAVAIFVASYLWNSVLMMYGEMCHFEEVQFETDDTKMDLENALRRRKCKSMVNEIILRRRLLDCNELHRDMSEGDELTMAIEDDDRQPKGARSLDALIYQLHHDWDKIDLLLVRRVEEQMEPGELSLKRRASRFLRLTSTDFTEAKENRNRSVYMDVPLSMKRTKDTGIQAVSLNKEILDRIAKTIRPRLAKRKQKKCLTHTILPSANTGGTVPSPTKELPLDRSEHNRKLVSNYKNKDKPRPDGYHHSGDAVKGSPSPADENMCKLSHHTFLKKGSGTMRNVMRCVLNSPTVKFGHLMHSSSCGSSRSGSKEEVTGRSNSIRNRAKVD